MKELASETPPDMWKFRKDEPCGAESERSGDSPLRYR
jgi:hypothetical protein